MTPSSVSRLTPEFDAFLFASIGVDSHEMLLSVVSALARLNLDPWQEAAALTDLPKEVATRRLAALIAKLPVEQSGKLDQDTIAARLIALLPPKYNAAVAPTQSQGAGATRDPRIAMFLFFAMSMLVALSMAANQRAPSQPDHGRPAVSGLISQPPLSPNAPQKTLK